ncbi:MAG: UvrD-helicase domain-containing protein [Verrucomicrobiae bacterium]|nr:UvrD-helicase domain-containing protein [Verrucomicrobiae bacterium]
MSARKTELPPDHAERRKIVELLDTTLLVEAAAGTGKTTAMVERIVALVAGQKCAPENLAAVTFTRKAAGELRQKLQEKLPGAERCFIGTIHSFCGRLLRERPVEAGVNPDFEELDEERDARLRRQAWDSFSNELFAKDDPLLDHLDELGLSLADLKQAFEKFANYPDVEEWPVPEIQPPELEPVVAALRDYAEHMRKNLPEEGGSDPLAGLFRRVLRMMRTHDLSRPPEVAAIFEQFKATKAKDITQKNWPGKKDQALREHARWNKFCEETAQPFLARWRAHCYPTALEVLKRAQVTYDRLREAAGRLNFQDLLMRAARMLREHPEVRRYFRQRFTHVLVDEFQDTDPVQAEVLLLLTAKDPGERDWRKCRPVPGSLFVVGDPKQSIYRFRRADIVTYNIVKEIILKAGGQCVTLSANFRSAPELVDWVNGTFGCEKFFPKTANDFAPAYVPLLVGRTEPAKAPGVFRLKVKAEKGNQDAVAAAEADFIARHIRAEVDAGRRTPGDFMIVTRRKDRLSVYAEALQRLGLPHEVTGGTALNEVRELELLYLAARAALEPDNPVAVVAALRSELFGVSDRELYRHRRNGGRFDWRCEADGAIAEAFGRLRECADWLATLPPVIALERIAHRLGLFALGAASESGAMAAGSLDKALELLRAGQADWPTATAAVAQIGCWIEREQKCDGASATAPSEAVVRVMNLHKVKGLQAPVVFLADPSGASEHEVQLHVDRRAERITGYLAVFGKPLHESAATGPLLAHPHGWQQLAEREAQFEEAEKNRLLYVAATRARDQLIVSLREERSESNPWEPLSLALGSAPELADPGAQSAPRIKPEVVTAAAVEAAAEKIVVRWQQVKSPTYVACAAKPPPEPVFATPASGRDEEELAMRWGSVIHMLLQASMRGQIAGDWKGAAVSALREMELDETLAERAVAVASEVVRSELWQRAQSARQLMVEVPVVVCLASSPPTIMRAVVDLAFEESDGWVLMDYKTDRVKTPEALLEKYRGQLENYRACWQTATGKRVKELGLYSTHLGRYVVLS